MLQIKRVLDADFDEIVSLHLGREGRRTLEGFYVSVLRHYFSGDTDALARLIERVGESELPLGEKEMLVAVGRGRMAARRRACGEKEIRALREAMPADGPWRAELHYVLALCFESMDRTREMSEAYLRAARELKACGVARKSVKALFNHIAAEHSLHPGRKFLAEFQHCYREAKRAKAQGTAGMALVNISREYQLIGAFDAALRYVNRALALFGRQRFGRSYFLALAHRAHVLYLMGRKEEAKADYEEALLCAFPDVKSSLETLRAIFSGKQEQEEKPVLQSWEGRVREAAGGLRPNLGPLEQRLLQHLGEKPRTRWELIEFLYGTSLSAEVLENRFNNTFQRLKKKVPGLIVKSNGKFSLGEALLEARLKKNA